MLQTLHLWAHTMHIYGCLSSIGHTHLGEWFHMHSDLTPRAASGDRAAVGGEQQEEVVDADVSVAGHVALGGAHCASAAQATGPWTVPMKVLSAAQVWYE